jgi:polysaccharide deacetylase 2 family uncharacterized protein YibQ
VLLLLLLVAIAALLVVLITLLPDDADPGRSGREATRDDGGSESTTDVGRETTVSAEGEEPGDGGSPVSESVVRGAEPGEAGGDVTETYPEGEILDHVTPSDRTDALWWLPAQVSSGPPAGRLYLVLDDAGNQLEPLEEFLSIPIPFALAILPQRAYSVESSFLADAAGKQVILHLPMEAAGAADPGVGAIRGDLSEEQIRQLIEANLDSVPLAIGINNHMGSRATADPRVMNLVLGEAKRRNLYFLDSRTTSRSVAATVAQELGVPFAERDVFLDNERERDSILGSLSRALELAYSQHDVILIGHVTVPLLAEILREVQPVLDSYGFEFGTLTDLYTDS